MRLPLAYYGNAILRKKAASVVAIDDQVKKLVADMIETMDAHNGCGLAAPQVNCSQAIFVTCIPKYHEDELVEPGKLKIYINPKIVDFSREICILEEACLSIPGIEEVVERPFRVTIQATDLDGESFTEEFEEFDAHVIMHEYDHIHGVLFIDRIANKRKMAIEPRLKAIKKKYNPPQSQ